MAFRGERFMICPDCTKRGVYLKMSATFDIYRCRRCDWYTYPDAGDRLDRENMDRLKAANPEEFGTAAASQGAMSGKE